ncbi:hypothetical protein QYF36_001936 [Acer negundo]|nr:hypothetical protein QYF36_001936 [Acer negundo]
MAVKQFLRHVSSSTQLLKQESRNSKAKLLFLHRMLRNGKPSLVSSRQNHASSDIASLDHPDLLSNDRVGIYETPRKLHVQQNPSFENNDQ